MIKNLILSVFLLFSIATNAEIFPTKPPTKKPEFNHKSVASVFPFRAFANTMMFGFETKTSDKACFKIVAGVTYFEKDNIGFTEIYNYTGGRFEAQYKNFIGKNAKAFNGLYVAPFLLYKTSSFKYETNKVNGWQDTTVNGSVNMKGAGIVFGYQTTIGESATIDFFLGQGFFKSKGRNPEDLDNANRPFDTFSSAIGFYTGFSVGIGL